MNIIGHKEQIEQLKRIVDKEHIGNAYIFHGISGIGKLIIAKEFAKDILKNENYILIQPEDKLIKVDVIRSLKEEMMLKPTTSDRKVAIINDAECMNEQAQNALLKILEEPPEYVTIILVTSNKEKLLHTIKSRCIEFKFNPLSKDEIQEYFNNELDEYMIEYGRGSIGNIIKTQNDNAQDIVKRWVEAFKKTSLIDTMKELNSIKEEEYVKNNLDDFLGYLLFSYYNSLKQGDCNAVKSIEIVEETRNNIMRNANVDIALDRMIINLWKWGKTCKK